MRPRCPVQRCPNVTKYMRRTKNGDLRYHKLCEKHHRIKYGMVVHRGHRGFNLPPEVAVISTQPCILCGWNKSYCDRHRLKHGTEGGRYEEGNVVPLCPTCHRVEHYGSLRDVA